MKVIYDSEKPYLTKRVFKNGDKARIVDEGLTEAEAQKLVQEDIESNPNAEYYMLVYCRIED